MTERIKELIDEIEVFLENTERERPEILSLIPLMDKKDERGRMSLRALLHALPAFYTAVETLLHHAVDLFGNGLGGAVWHKELLQKAHTGRNRTRPQILSVETYNLLDDFRGFRHFCRYNSFIDQYSLERVRENGRRYEKITVLLREDLLLFADFLRAFDGPGRSLTIVEGRSKMLTKDTAAIGTIDERFKSGSATFAGSTPVSNRHSQFPLC